MCSLSGSQGPLPRTVLEYRLDRSPFVLGCHNARTETLAEIIFEELFAHYFVLMVHKQSGLQLIFNEFAEASRFLIGLNVSLGKTEALSQPVSGSTALLSSVSLEGTELKIVDNIEYLGSINPTMASSNRKSAPDSAKLVKSLGVCVLVC